MKTTKLYGLFFGVLMLTCKAAYSNDEPLKQLTDFLAKAKALSADFKQVSLSETGVPIRTSYGVFYLQRPGKFRWNYEKPFAQEIVANSGRVYFYDSDLEQVTIKKLDESLGSTPALLLSGDISIENNFTIENQGRSNNMEWLKLVPKSQETSFKYILIGLKQGELGGMELSDNFGQLTRIEFSQVLINPPLKSTLFQFTPPKGADVFSDE